MFELTQDLSGGSGYVPVHGREAFSGNHNNYSVEKSSKSIICKMVRTALFDW